MSLLAHQIELVWIEPVFAPLISSQGMADTVLPENYIMEETPLGESNSLKSIGTMLSHLIATGKKSS